ncbi:MAG: hypothetical protein WA063_07045 [Minisyncoccia bacterium]
MPENEIIKVKPKEKNIYDGILSFSPIMTQKEFYWCIFGASSVLFSLWTMEKYTLVGRNDNLLFYPFVVPIIFSLIIYAVNPFRGGKIQKFLFEGVRMDKSGPRFAFLLLVTMPSAWLAVGLVLFINANFDYSRPITYEISISNKEIDKNGMHKILFSLPGEGEIRLDVNYKEYDKYKIGSPLKVTIKKGALGSNWIKKVE